MLGALAAVVALFLGGVWLVRNSQRLGLRRGHSPRLNVLEVKSLGNRHALFVVGYEQQRMLLASSPNGVNLICHLPESDAAEPAPVPVTTVSFADALQHLVGRKA
jgi:flagellar biogenesis protein FliO